MTSLAVVALTVRFDDIIGIAKDVMLILICIAIVSCGVILSQLKKVAVLHGDEQLIFIEIKLHRWTVSRRELLLSNYSWVRARHPEGHVERIVEAGTRGYEIIEMLKLPCKSRQSIAEATRICEEISSAVRLENRGFKEVA